MAGWNVATGAGPAGPGTVTLFDGACFCISAARGEIRPGAAEGLFYEDTRVLSLWQVLLDGVLPEPLGTLVTAPHSATFLSRGRRDPGVSDADVLLERRRHIGAGLREDLTLRNFGTRAVDCELRIRCAADFADLFEVKEDWLRRRWEYDLSVDTHELSMHGRWQEHRRGVVVEGIGARVDEYGLTFDVHLEPRTAWTSSVHVEPTVDGTRVPRTFPVHRPLEEAGPFVRHAAWQRRTPVARAGTEHLEQVLEQSAADLGALRIHDPRHPDRAVVAAGAPWFMALFGRDALLTSYMALPVDPHLALGTVETLADRQGRRTDPATEEEPGKILHEVRFGVDSVLALGGGSAYYGSVDATPLFVVLVGELCRWGVSDERLAALLPAVDRALSWVAEHGDRDGDGFVEYERATDTGLVNQGWKDSWDGIAFADGTLAHAPLALCEVQGYVHDAYLARALLADRLEQGAGADAWRDRAARLRRRFDEAFWLPEHGWYAVALDRDKRPVDSCTSNMGHLLWSGLVPRSRARAVADRLLAPEMFTGWGVRTLATDMGSYNPAGYHTGSVWPHDNALLAAGLMRYGFVEHAQRIALGVLDAARHFDARLPELFCGFGRDEYPEPVPYPTACSPQAWAAAAPYQLLRTLLRLDPDVPAGTVHLAPALPEELGRVWFENAPLAGARVTVRAETTTGDLVGLPDGLTLSREPADPPGHARPAPGEV